MRRHPFSFRSRVYTQMNRMSQFLPVLRQMVLPGQSIEGSLHLTMQSAPSVQVFMNPGVLSVQVYYVPLRLIWPEFVELVTQNGTPEVPTVSVDTRSLFEAPGGSALYRRAVKLVYNEYYGYDAPIGDGYYDVMDDTGAWAWKSVMTLNGLLRTALRATDLESGEYEAPVAGGVATVNLAEFSRAMSSQAPRWLQSSSGDKYVDFLRRVGVEPTWAIQMAPELLASRTVDVKPSYTQATTNSTTVPLGYGATRYISTLELGMPRRSFAEHGYLVAFAVFRPVALNTVIRPPDNGFQFASDFWLGDDGYDVLNPTAMGYDAGSNLAIPAGAVFTAGLDYVGKTTTNNMANTYSQTDAVQDVYRLNQLSTASPMLDDDFAAFFASWSFKGVAPVSNRMRMGVLTAGGS